MAIIAVVNRILFRRSGILKTFFRLESTWCRLVQLTALPLWAGRVRREIVPVRWSAVGKLVALDGRSSGLPLRLERQRNERHRTAGGGDRRLGGLGDGVGVDGDRRGQLATGEHLDVLALAGEAVLDEHLRVDGAAGVTGELGDGVEVDRLVLDAERVVEALQLGDPLLERHLAALEAARDGSPG